ncbi:hypothetical protein ABW19_dt0204674 [Dactylella cylindrospora]|nr:hypothetical protein ABW19_dt0204674 [Dactylella cylindrospora]
MWFPFPPIFPWRIIAFFIFFLSPCFAGDILKLLGELPPPMWGPNKRDLDSSAAIENLTLAERVQQLELARVERRQDYEYQVYYLSSTMEYMATPYGNCNNDGSGADSSCPTDYICVCQQPGSSICLTTLVASDVACGTPYAGPTVQPPTTMWVLTETDTYMAAPWGQCGGTTPTAGTSWNSAKTACPRDQVCDCQDLYYSQCIPLTEAAISGTACPSNSWGCQYPTDVTLPPPEATASIWEQCGGRCWTGPTNCPEGASCWTETSPNPGAYAMCDTAKPENDYYKVRLKGRGEAINVPARVQAVATPIAF